MLLLCFSQYSGHYAYIETSYPRVKGDVARLTSDRFKVSKGYNWCLNFWYHMNGKSVRSLSVKIKIYPFQSHKPYYRPLWKRQLNHGDAWLADNVQINSPDDFEVFIVGFIAQVNIEEDKLGGRSNHISYETQYNCLPFHQHGV